MRRAEAVAAHAEHFESLEREVTAVRLGMWIFLGSETLLFAGLFGLYATYRVAHPGVFAAAIDHNDKLLGSLNTVVLIGSSYAVAMAHHVLKGGRPDRAVKLIGVTLALAATFLCIKAFEYGHHFDEGIYPGGRGAHFAGAPAATAIFFTLYFATTGLHAVHVVAGMAVLAWIARRIHQRRVTAEREHVLELGALYWHLVDVVWIFLWPLYYLTGAS